MKRKLIEKQLLRMAGEIRDKQYNGEPFDEEIKEFQKNVLYPNVEELFLSDKSEEYIVKLALSYKSINLGDLSRDELINLVKRIQNNEADEEYKADHLIQIVKNAVVDPYITDYIFFEDELTAEQIVDKALSYKPIIL